MRFIFVAYGTANRKANPKQPFFIKSEVCSCTYYGHTWNNITNASSSFACPTLPAFKRCIGSDFSSNSKAPGSF